ncbi:SDR family NAD(P)-dependent oxidoreductase [Sulfitobacter sp. S190]|uniref:SDR family NAD(P)-dependent oxidoreductase n=1 Tax=Sulfitobacter sp. S190 TaxID=2867022 RepID=UPI0021A792D0|nr:SDR family NAD(P)-dependent oxidoreductase [Sulfitobacter sp. S190]UWR21755.1 SDR family NAD(P)-dependent oxidoreductase [Sulfitobacter sp. S190]
MTSISHNSASAPKMSRRDMLRTGTIGAATVAASTVATARAGMAQSGAAAKELEGKTAFITGGARGIGLASAEEMARAGANIVLFDIATREVPHVQYPLSSPDDLAQATARIEAHGVRCLAVQGDVRDLQAQEDAMAEAVATFGGLDIVLANAGVSQAGRIEEFSANEMSTQYEINVAGMVKTTQAAVPHLRANGGGRIIYMSSGLGRVGNDLFPVYTSTKWAVIGFAKSAALSYGRDNIMCNVVAPGLVRTPLADNPVILGKMLPDHPAPTFDAVSALLEPGNPIPVGHHKVEDIAKAVMFFAGDATRNMTAEVLDVSYGSAARNIG